jgi:2-polyprenyl-6-hydroxyphenyl methylase/3-demethylubiquinone-9 3-methyltransferase
VPPHKNDGFTIKVHTAATRIKILKKRFVDNVYFYWLMTEMKKTLRWSIAQNLEVRWWQRYLSDKNPEEYLVWKTNYWNGLLAELGANIPDLKGKTVLDAGCGPAGIFLSLPNSEVTAIDPLLDAYAALPHFKPERLSHVKFVKTPLELFQPAEKYDVVFCLNAINHVSDIGKAYDALVAAVKPGGTLVVSIDAHNHGLLKHIFRALPGDALHPHQYDLAEYGEFLTERGCKILTSLRKDKGFIFDYYVQVARKA